MSFIHRQIQFIIFLFLVIFIVGKFEILCQKKIIILTKSNLGNYKIGHFHSDVEFEMGKHCSFSYILYVF